jgi:hypothetical protein
MRGKVSVVKNMHLLRVVEDRPFAIHRDNVQLNDFNEYERVYFMLPTQACAKGTSKHSTVCSSTTRTAMAIVHRAWTALCVWHEGEDADMESHEGVGRDIHFCKGGGQIVYLILVTNVVLLESEFESVLNV